MTDRKLLVQINRVNTKIVILINREADNYIDYSQTTQIIRNKLIELRQKNIENVEILGRVVNNKILEFKKILEPTFDVVLESINSLFKDRIILELRITTLKQEEEIKNLINSLPTVIKAKVSKQKAEQLKNKFNQLQAQCLLIKTYDYLEKDVEFSIKKEGDAG